MRELATKAEELLLEKQGLALATALVLCPSRDSAIPFYDVASHYVGEGVRESLRVCFSIVFILFFSDFLLF